MGWEEAAREERMGRRDDTPMPLALGFSLVASGREGLARERSYGNALGDFTAAGGGLGCFCRDHYVCNISWLYVYICTHICAHMCTCMNT